MMKDEEPAGSDIVPADPGGFRLKAAFLLSIRPGSRRGGLGLAWSRGRMCQRSVTAAERRPRSADVIDCRRQQTEGSTHTLFHDCNES